MSEVTEVMETPQPIVAPTIKSKTPDSPIVFFDGVCGLCDRTVQTLLIWDTSGKLRFAPLQGETAAAHVPESFRTNLSSLILLDQRGLSWRSTAVVRILDHVGGWSRVLAWGLWLIPWPIREVGYRLISRCRYALFGKREACRLPRPGEAIRFMP